MATSDAFLRSFDIKKSIEKPFSRVKSFITASTRHFSADQQLKNEIKQKKKPRLDHETARKAQKKTAEAALKVNNVVTSASNKTAKLIEGSGAGKLLSKISKNKWAKRSMWAAGGLIALNMLESAMTGFKPSPAIPKHYEKGYDVMRQSMTEFGSPVKLSKAAAKVIMPYCSTVRKATKTNVKTVIDKNFALFSSKNAIRHTGY